ncbi:MAG: endonuclease [Puniceicoccaceae bacterium]|nr:MAG: endonuclease [Puniceicoccaceae bacterium]
MNFFNQLRQVFSREPKLPGPESSRAARGQYGEDLAAAYCRRELGYAIIARNWRYKRYELDIICRQGPVLIFVEVRARAADALVSGFHSVNWKKKKVLHRACKAYIKQLQNKPKHVRFDIIDISLAPSGEGTVRHYANVPLFSKHDTCQS